MLSFASLLLLCAVVLTLLLQWHRKTVRNLLGTIHGRRISLIERRCGLAHTLGFGRLQAAINELIEENRKRAQAEENNLGQVDATLGSLRDGILILDGKNRIALANEAFRRLLQIPHSVVDRPIESLIEGSGFHAYIASVQSGEEAEDFELVFTSGDEERFFEVTGTRLPKQNANRASLSLFVLHDVTRQKQLERMRTEFVANVSHELRTPVTIIKGFTDALADDHMDLSPEETDRFLEKIRKNVARLHQLLEELLMLSRLEAHPDSIRREPHSFSRVVGEAAESCRARVESVVPSFSLNLSGDADTVRLDPFSISRVVENLLENAVRHAHGCQRLSVHTRVEETEVVCEVRDDGAGIPEEDLPHIFERFYRVDKGRSRESGGTGLGLSIVKHIVQKHGGRVEVESAPGKGTTMRFTIPFPKVLAERAVMKFVREHAGTGRASAPRAESS